MATFKVHLRTWTGSISHHDLTTAIDLLVIVVISGADADVVDDCRPVKTL